MKKIFLLITVCLLTTITWAQTWEIGYPNAEDVTATLGDATLTISGKGNMQDFRSGNPPWQSKYIKIVLIEQGITNIGIGTFYSVSSLTEITIPESVTSIGDWAFRYCESLIEITIPRNLQTIGEQVFQGCIRMKEINVDIDNLSFSSKDGVLFNRDKTTLIHYPAGKQEKVYFIPEGVTTIGVLAFEQCLLTSIAFPEGVTIIGVAAFSYCLSLTSINLPESLVTIEDGAFLYCESLREITIPKNVVNIGLSAFKSCAVIKITVKNPIPIIIPYEYEYSFPFFEQIHSGRCLLIVPIGSKEAYQTADGWWKFPNIIEQDFTSINNIENTEKTAIGYYNFSGQKLSQEPENGIYIVLYDDGTSEKRMKQ